MIVYACATTTCPERFKGFTDEPTHCSICWEDLTEMEADTGTLDALNTMAANHPVPPEVPEAW